MKERKEVTAGIIGLGMIGSGIAISLSRNGYISAVYDLNPEASEKIKNISKSFDSPEKVAQESDIIMICVANAEQARQVINGPGGILKASKKDMVVCLISTVSIDVINEFEKICEQNNVGFLDCGVTPGNLADQNGMVAIIGGENEAIDKAMPVLEAWSKKVICCGPAGAGMVTKIARNVITFGGWRIVKEAQRLVEASGVNPRKLLEVIETSDPQGKTLLSKLKQNDSLGKVPLEAATKIAPFMKKDLEAALNLASQKGVNIPTTAEVYRNTLDTLDMEESKLSNGDEQAKERGIKMADKVYGQGIGKRIAAKSDDNLFAEHTVNQLFANIWSRPGLSVRDRRLLTIGVTAGMGNNPELIKIQVLGALKNNELNVEQLEEIVLHLSYYAGWCNAGSVATGVNEAIIKFKEMQTKSGNLEG